ncbi:peptidase inhibitor family I36 protein [Streptomyces sp. NBC_00647]|uniref:peptidase inhibitor family I36 protein n=1 Tax=unclassified Streptomyces TaxID=2593676 RepID=UPI003248B66A
MKNLRRSAAVAAVLAAGATALTISPAAAADTTCSTGYACLYYHPNYQGAFFKQFPSIPNYSSYRFTTSANGSDGAGLSVRNNAASVDNWDFNNAFTVYYHINYTGASQRFAAGGGGNFNTTLRNENASGKFG